MKQAFYRFHKENIARAWQQQYTFLQAFLSVSGCQTCMCKRGIRQGLRTFKRKKLKHLQSA